MNLRKDPLFCVFLGFPPKIIDLKDVILRVQKFLFLPNEASFSYFLVHLVVNWIIVSEKRGYFFLPLSGN